MGRETDGGFLDAPDDLPGMELHDREPFPPTWMIGFLDALPDDVLQSEFSIKPDRVIGYRYCRQCGIYHKDGQHTEEEL